MRQYSINEVDETLLQEIREALKGLDYGSLEIYVQGGVVTQITKRQIKKINSVNQTRKK